MIGRVRRFNPERHFFGFIVIDADIEAAPWSREYFFHGSAIIGELPAVGDTVSFLLADGRQPGELVAIDVTVRTRRGSVQSPEVTSGVTP